MTIRDRLKCRTGVRIVRIGDGLGILGNLRCSQCPAVTRPGRAASWCHSWCETESTQDV
jgi:hypothetical protein